jgi:hypothetical protein
MNSIALILPNFIEHNYRIRTDCLNTILTFLDFAQLNLCFIAPLYSNSRAFNLTDFTPNHLWFSTDSLQINSHQLTCKNIWILNHHSVVSLRYNMHGTLFEIWELCIWALKIWINRNYSSCMIRLISNKFTPN